MDTEVLNNVTQNGNVVSKSDNAKDSFAQEYLAFISDDLHFVVSASNIFEIIVNHSITRLPKVPDFIKGVINLRGQIIPIIDIRLRMGKAPCEYTEEACIIVLDVNSISIGILVERVSHVINIVQTDIAPPPSKNKQELVNGIVRMDGVVYLVLDCDLLIDLEELMI